MSPSDSGLRVVLVTAPDVETAAELGRTLVAERLAACVNVVPGLRSIFRWEGSVQEEAEVLLVVKTQAARCQALAARLQDLHPYDLPEILELLVTGGSAAYLEWVRTESSP
jgi:periplasmic divalent cation tolerance protein